MQFDVAIIGGGALGLATAWSLARRGFRRVAVVERRSPAAGASGLGSGSISLHRWTAGDVKLVRRSVELMAELERLSGGVFRAGRCGRLTLAGPGQQTESLKELARIAAECGERAGWLDPDEAAARYPGIRFDDAGAVLYSPEDAWIQPPLLVATLWGLVQAAGVAVFEGATVTGVDIGDGRVQGVRLAGGQRLTARQVVVAAGPQSRAVLQGSGLDLPLKPYRTQVAFMLLPAVTPQPVVYDAISGFYTVPRNPGATLAGDGTHPHPGDPDQFRRDPDPEFYQSITERFRHRFPGHGPVTAIGGWAGICDMTPDGRPLIGPYGGVTGLHLACGFAGFGIMRSLGAGEALAELLSGGAPAVDLTPYRADRFQGWQEFELNFGAPYDPLGDH